MNRFFATSYHYKLIELIIKSTLSGILIANILVPLMSIYLLYEYIPRNILILGYFLHLIIFFSRIIIGKKLQKVLKIDSDLTKKYLKIVYFLLGMSAFLNGLMIWISVIYEVPALEFMVLSTIVFGISAGALTTISSVFAGYMIFILINMGMLIGAMIYHGGDVFNIFTLILIMFLVMLIVSGYKQYTTLRDVFFLEDTFKNIYENSSDGIVIIKNNRFQSCNMSIVKMFGFTDKDIFLAQVLENFSPKYQPDGKVSLIQMVRMNKKSLKNGVNTFEWLHLRHDGTQFWCEVVLTKINLKGNELIHGVWRDISHRKKIEALEIEYKKELELRVMQEVEKNMTKDRQLLHQSRLAQMGEMIGMIAHQWRQPLSAISTTSSSINIKSQMGILDDATAQELSNNIDEYTQHLSNTIDDFRSFFKPNQEKLYTNYNELLKSVFGIIKDSISSSSIDLIEDMRCNEEFKVFPNELKQVILNLVKNAEDVLLDKNIKNPYIKISSYSQNDNCILEVSDNGGGINQEIIDKIFDPYFSTKTKKDGTGMGLYMSKIIVDKHCKGELSVSNDEDGAVFKISIKKG